MVERILEPVLLLVHHFEVVNPLVLCGHFGDALMAPNVDTLSTNGASLSASVDTLSTKIDSLHLAGDLDRLPPLVDSATKTQGLVTSLHAEFSYKYIPDMNCLHRSRSFRCSKLTRPSTTTLRLLSSS